jgi:energy-coupling factor transporter ATP-binding protein EcfA2
VNVFIGENGTGKTHVMKVLYAVQDHCEKRLDSSVRSTLLDLFQIESVDNLRSTWLPYGEKTEVQLIFAPNDSLGKPGSFVLEISHDIVSRRVANLVPVEDRPIFIPAFDMIAHSQGFLASERIIKQDFDSASKDLLSYLGTKRQRMSLSDTISSVESRLAEVLPGTLEQDASERFFLVNERGRFAIPMVAEGLRKIATLRRLVEQKWLYPGTTLFWDEPEVSLNPKLMDEVAQAILLLARSGVQVFIASHSYLILKELEVNQQPGDSLRYFAFDPTPEGTVVRPSDTYFGLSPNPIEAQYASLYDRQIQKEMARAEAGSLGAVH